MSVNILKGIGLFVLGVGAGILASNQFFKKKYETIANDEIEDMKIFAKKRAIRQGFDIDGEPEIVAEASGEEVATLERDRVKYHKAADRYGSKEEFDANKAIWEKEQAKPKDPTRIPYIISPNEYIDENEDYEKLGLTFYELDGVLADDRDEIVDNIEKRLGYESLQHFGEKGAGKDELYVRNDFDRCDYEIVRSNLSFEDVTNG